MPDINISAKGAPFWTGCVISCASLTGMPVICSALGQPIPDSATTPVAEGAARSIPITPFTGLIGLPPDAPGLLAPRPSEAIATTNEATTPAINNAGQSGVGLKPNVAHAYDTAAIIIQSIGNEIASLNATVQMIVILVGILGVGLPIIQWRQEQRRLQDLVSRMDTESERLKCALEKEIQDAKEILNRALDDTLSTRVKALFEERYAPQMMNFLGHALEEAAMSSQASRVAIYTLAGEFVDGFKADPSRLHEVIQEFLKRWLALSQLFSADRLVQEQGAQKLAYGTPTVAAISRLEELIERYREAKDLPLKNVLRDALRASNRGSPISAAEKERFAPPPCNLGQS